MSSKSSQVNNLALGGYSGVRFFLQLHKFNYQGGEVSSSKSSQVNNLALGGYSSSRIFYLANHKLIALIGSSKLSQADNPALGGYLWKSFFESKERVIKQPRVLVELWTQVLGATVCKFFLPSK